MNDIALPPIRHTQMQWALLMVVLAYFGVMGFFCLNGANLFMYIVRQRY